MDWKDRKLLQVQDLFVLTATTELLTQVIWFMGLKPAWIVIICTLNYWQNVSSSGSRKELWGNTIYHYKRHLVLGLQPSVKETHSLKKIQLWYILKIHFNISLWIGLQTLYSTTCNPNACLHVEGGLSSDTLFNCYFWYS